MGIFDPVGRVPSKGPQPGAAALHRYTLARFNGRDLGIFNPRDVCGNAWPPKPPATKLPCVLSFHAEGRAGDAGFPVQRPNGHPDGSALADWLVANANALGVQEVIWAGRRWTTTTRKWQRYTGRSDHFDHVHWSLNRDAARTLTGAHIEAVTRDAAPIPDREVDVPAPSDIVAVVPAGPLGIDRKAHYKLRADGLVEVHGGVDYGDYHRLKPEHRRGDRYFVDLIVDADGYTLYANDGRDYRFDPGTRVFLVDGKP